MVTRQYTRGIRSNMLVFVPNFVYFKNIVFFGILFGSLLTNSTAGTVGNTCKTPSNQSGRCVKTVDCPVYKTAYDTYFKNNTEFFRLVQCGYDDNYPKICCPDSGNYIISTIRVPTTKRFRERVDGKVENRFGDSGSLPGRDLCGKQTFDDRIINGEVTEIDEFPWMALLFYRRTKQKYNFGCAGVLINDKHVLTAAHCVMGDAYSATGGLEKVRLGEYNIETPEDCVVEANYLDCADPHVDVLPHSITTHPRYRPNNRNQHNDIALIELEERVTYSDFIQPICLPDVEVFPQFGLQDGNQLFVAGWGRNELGVNSPVKLKVKVPIVNKDKCHDSYNEYRININNRQICAGGEQGKDSCKGDSGGPLMTTDPLYGNWISSGVVSIGPSSCGTSGIPGIYTDVRNYIDWIKANLKS